MTEHEDFRTLQKMIARHGDTDIALWLADIAGRYDKLETQKVWLAARNQILALRRRESTVIAASSRAMEAARRQDAKIQAEIRQREAEYWKEIRKNWREK